MAARDRLRTPDRPDTVVPAQKIAASADAEVYGGRASGEIAAFYALRGYGEVCGAVSVLRGVVDSFIESA